MEYVDQRPHIIAVHANCYGPLRKGEYQLAFEGSIIDPAGSTGFLVPQSGRIKKVQLKTLYREYTIENFDIVGPLFTIIAGKDRYEVTNLRTYECTKISEDPRNNYHEIRCRSDSENMPISEGDIINIRSDLFTFLLELDPL